MAQTRSKPAESVPARLFVDFGSAYIRAAVQLPDRGVKYVKFNDQNVLPTYLALAANPEEVYIGHNARSVAETGVRQIVFCPGLFLRKPTATWYNGGTDNEWTDWATPYSARVSPATYSAPATWQLLVGAADGALYTPADHGCRVRFQPARSYHDAIELNREFLFQLREICQEYLEQIGDNYFLIDCVLAAHNLSVIEANLNAALRGSGFTDYDIQEREVAQIKGLLLQFPVLRERRSVAILRLGANVSTLCIYSIHPRTGLVTVQSTLTQRFGGNNIDLLLMRYCLKRFVELHQLERNAQLSLSVDNLHRLRMNCEAVKIQLSTTKAVTLRVNQFYEGRDLVVELTSEIFRDLLGNWCYKNMKPFVDHVDKIVGADRSSTELVLLGGTSKIPLVQDIVSWTLQKPNRQVRSAMDELVLIGMTGVPSTSGSMPTAQASVASRSDRPATSSRTAAPSNRHSMIHTAPVWPSASGPIHPTTGNRSPVSGFAQAPASTLRAGIPEARARNSTSSHTTESLQTVSIQRHADSSGSAVATHRRPAPPLSGEMTGNAYTAAGTSAGGMQRFPPSAGPPRLPLVSGNPSAQVGRAAAPISAAMEASPHAPHHRMPNQSGLTYCRGDPASSVIRFTSDTEMHTDMVTRDNRMLGQAPAAATPPVTALSTDAIVVAAATTTAETPTVEVEQLITLEAMDTDRRNPNPGRPQGDIQATDHPGQRSFPTTPVEDPGPPSSTTEGVGTTADGTLIGGQTVNILGESHSGNMLNLVGTLSSSDTPQQIRPAAQPPQPRVPNSWYIPSTTTPHPPSTAASGTILGTGAGYVGVGEHQQQTAVDTFHSTAAPILPENDLLSEDDGDKEDGCETRPRCVGTDV